ncbi:curli production assembly/transport component CsgG [Caballeronia terrestris]|uniref:Curli production assembly/transport component CsgG n=3 Tax=Caballeronia TaxID=1827195 RepID=A0A158KU35_9BURK|nr:MULTISPECIES: CsgG/HfaB family protein [Caballeronia]SAL60241.1 curli production assembly/transport component CsgG [Caballeronia humi]SAL84686.1 curli production assembly/transport component CsgG [Caballeronia terrestris]
MNKNSAKTAALRATLAAMIFSMVLLTGCVTQPMPSAGNATLTPPTRVTRDLTHLPPPKGRITAAVYGFRDLTGQYKPSPDSSFSSQVTQGGASFLVKAMRDSGWFTPVERENLQDLLTERKIMRALETPDDKNRAGSTVPQIGALAPASIVLEGGIVGYDSNIRTGGAGVAYLGISASQQYRVDQVTVNLRAVDIRNGTILNSVSTTKTIYSIQVDTGVYRFIGFKDLLQAEIGMTRNEPQQLCVNEAIESALVHLIVQGVGNQTWSLKDMKDWYDPTMQRYLQENQGYAQTMEAVNPPYDPAKIDPPKTLGSGVSG